MAPNFVADVSVLLSICCNIGCGMPYLCISVFEELAMLLDAVTTNGVNTCVWSELEHKQ